MSDKRVTVRQKTAVAKQAEYCCEYCKSQARFAIQSFSIEHILPKSQGGTTTLNNLAFACQGCNNHKYNKTEAQDPITGETVPLFNPRKQQWSSHFSWSDDFTLIIGLTSIGRATIEALQLNRSGIVNLRRILYVMGEHPQSE